MKIMGEAMQNILHHYFADLIDAEEFTRRMIISDEYYRTVEVDFVLDSVRTDPILVAEKYRRNVFDCDDYVLYLKTKLNLYAHARNFHSPFALGILLTKEHAFNFCISPDQSLYLINTQSNDHAVTNDIEQFGDFLNLREGNTIQLVYI
jgi:hypothetical protein